MFFLNGTLKLKQYCHVTKHSIKNSYLIISISAILYNIDINRLYLKVLIKLSPVVTELQFNSFITPQYYADS